MKKETRYFDSEVRVDAQHPNRIQGYAVVFNSESVKIGDFYERIAPTAFEGLAEQKAEVLGLFNHLPDNLLARQENDSLELEVDERGLYYRMSLPDTSLGRDVLELVRSGLVTRSSFGFTVENDTWEQREDGSYTRTVLRVDRLYDVSPVTRAAYPATSVSARSYPSFPAPAALSAAERLHRARTYRVNRQRIIKAKLNLI